MKIIRFFPVFALAFAAACTLPPTVAIKSKSIAADHPVYRPAPTEKRLGSSGDGLVGLGTQDLTRFAFALDREYQQLAFQTEQVNIALNGAMFVSAMALALNPLYGVTDEVIARRTVAALGISEIATYADSNQAARALRLAASDALCMATTTSQGTGAGNDFQKSTKFVAALRWSHNNLRQRLKRRRFNITDLVTRLSESSTEGALKTEDTITVTNALLTTRAEADDDDYMKRLAGCLS